MGMTNRIREMLTEEAKRRRIPLNANFELLPVCNLDCRMCFIRMTKEEVNKAGGLLAPEA